MNTSEIEVVESAPELPKSTVGPWTAYVAFIWNVEHKRFDMQVHDPKNQMNRSLLLEALGRAEFRFRLDQYGEDNLAMMQQQAQKVQLAGQIPPSGGVPNFRG